jgi:hypothetical protein
MQQRLGRLQHTDVRDHAFLLPRPAELPPIMRKLWATGGKAFNQGKSSECVSFSTNKWLTASPVRQHIWPKGFDDFYAACQAVDEWSGTPHDGTSVRAAFKVLAAAGYVSEYRWAFDVPTVVSQILTGSPVVAGSDWTEEMFTPDQHGFIRVSTDGKYNVAGGHAYLLSGIDRKKKCPDGSVGAFQITNSWGPSWAVNGQAWISLVDFGILLNHEGEAAVATEVKVTPGSVSA